jgi:hypothetical protein
MGGDSKPLRRPTLRRYTSETARKFLEFVARPGEGQKLVDSVPDAGWVFQGAEFWDIGVRNYGWEYHTKYRHWARREIYDASEMRPRRWVSQYISMWPRVMCAVRGCTTDEMGCEEPNAAMLSPGTRIQARHMEFHSTVRV